MSGLQELTPPRRAGPARMQAQEATAITTIIIITTITTIITTIISIIITITITITIVTIIIIKHASGLAWRRENMVGVSMVLA